MLVESTNLGNINHACAVSPINMLKGDLSIPHDQRPERPPRANDEDGFRPPLIVFHTYLTCRL